MTSEDLVQQQLTSYLTLQVLQKQSDLLFQNLNGKLIGSAQRVPTPTGSTTILTAVVEGNVTVDEVNAAMKAAQTESFGYNDRRNRI